MNDGTGTALELVAEQIAWRKGKSSALGALWGSLPRFWHGSTAHIVYGFTRHARRRWSEWDGRPMNELASLLDSNRGEPRSSRNRNA